MTPLALPAVLQYINYQDVIQYVGADKIEVNDEYRTAIPIETANQLVAQGVSLVIKKLSPFYQTVPEIKTVKGESWLSLRETCPSTYNDLLFMFVYRSCFELVSNYDARNTDEMHNTLSAFQNLYISKYNELMTNLNELLPNGSYKYPFAGLALNTQGILRTPKRYARTGSLGVLNYIDRQATNPQKNFSNWNGAAINSGVFQS